MQSNFEKVCVFNELIGNKPCNGSMNWSKLSTQYALIKEEFEELTEAMELTKVSDVRDAISDILVTTYGLAYLVGVNADHDFDKVHATNMSKFCKTSVEALETGAKYEQQGIQVDYRTHNVQEGTTLIAVISAKDQFNTNGKFFPYGKLLKSVNFQEPVFN